MTRSVRNIFLAAGALSGLLALGGCGGGGGGGSLNGVPPVAFTYPSSLATSTSNDTVDGFISPYAINTTTPSLVSVLPGVSGTTPSAGTIQIAVAAIALPTPSSATEPAFVVTFNPAGGTPLSLTSPLDNLATSPCTGCLKTVQAPAIVNGAPTTTMVTFTYLDPTSASFPLTYSALGMWTKPTTTGTGGTPDSSWPEVGGAFSAGVLTRGIDLPTTGTASYSGYFIGRYAASNTATSLPAAGTYLVGANAQAGADFSGAGAVTFSTSGTMVTNEATSAVSAASGLNLASSTMTITRGLTSNSFTGTVGTTAGGLTGQIVGGFYGQPATTAPYAPPEMGGSLSVGDTTGNKNMVGSFALKR